MSEQDKPVVTKTETTSTTTTPPPDAAVAVANKLTQPQFDVKSVMQKIEQEQRDLLKSHLQLIYDRGKVNVEQFDAATHNGPESRVILDRYIEKKFLVENWKHSCGWYSLTQEGLQKLEELKAS